MTDLSKVLNDNAGVDDEQFKEMITQNSLFKDIYKSDIRLASDLDDDEDEEDDDFDEEDEDLFDEGELEEEGYEEDFDFDEEDEEDDESEDLGAYN